MASSQGVVDVLETSANSTGFDRTLLREIVIHLVKDALSEKPDCILAFMSSWAVAKLNASASATQHMSAEEIEVELQVIAEGRAKMLRDVAAGAKDTYMIALEDSDNDLEHLRHLEAAMHNAHDDVMLSRAEDAELNQKLQAIHDGTYTEEARLALLRSLHCNYQSSQ